MSGLAPDGAAAGARLDRRPRAPGRDRAGHPGPPGPQRGGGALPRQRRAPGPGAPGRRPERRAGAPARPWAAAGGWTWSRLGPDELLCLQELQLLPPGRLGDPAGRMLLLGPDLVHTALVGDEDHVRLQTWRAGLDPDGALAGGPGLGRGPGAGDRAGLRRGPGLPDRQPRQRGHRAAHLGPAAPAGPGPGRRDREGAQRAAAAAVLRARPGRRRGHGAGVPVRGGQHDQPGPVGAGTGRRTSAPTS